MANFATHLYGGIFASGTAVLGLQGLGLVPTGQTLVLFALGVGGSLLPDIDSDSSAPVRAFFGLLGSVLAFAWTLPLVGQYPPLWLGLFWVGCFLAVRFLLLGAFARFTVHRGIWHSLLGVAFAALATVNLAHGILRESAESAWVSGAMVGMGYLTHLVLDELSSVDLKDARVRRSFGSALKPLSLKNPLSSLTMAAAVALLAWLAPPNEGRMLPDGAELVAWAEQAGEQISDWSHWGIEALRVWLSSEPPGSGA